MSHKTHHGTHKENVHKNTLGEYVALSAQVFTKHYGVDITNPQMAKELTRINLSGPLFALETLVGPEGGKDGLMSDTFKLLRGYVQIMNISRNQLTDISCLDKKQRDGITPEFKSLQILIASRNQLTSVTLTLDNLLELNLANNELTEVPATKGLKSLQKLILAHNKINDTLKPLESNKRLRELYLHDNLFTWKPTEFARQMEILSNTHLSKLTLWPNPFAQNFTEYQFLAVTRIETLGSLDGYDIDYDLRVELQRLEEVMRANSALDYSIFDIKVQERQGTKSAVQQAEQEYTDLGRVPKLSQLLNLLNKPLDHPNELIKYVYEFKTQVCLLWGATYADRVKQMEIKDAGEEELQVREFSDKMQQLLGRFDSAQDALVECLVRMCASGNARLSQESALLLSEWVDSLPVDLQENLQGIANPLFRELRVRMLPGMQSFLDSPLDCMYVNKGTTEGGRVMEGALQEKYDDNFFGGNEAIAETAEILGALSKFGRPGFQKQSQLGRSTVLEPMLAVLCRTPRKILGQPKPRDMKQKYEGFGVFHGASVGGWPSDRLTASHSGKADESLDSEGVSGPTVGFVEMCYGRCVKRNLGGFVVREMSLGILEAKFVHETSDALRGLRIPEEGATLHVMPAVAAVSTKKEVCDIKEAMTWDVWRNALDVLVVATACPKNSKKCVRQFKIYEAVIKHCDEVFTEALLNVTAEAGTAFTSLMHLAANLMRGHSKAAQEARVAFTRARLHVDCWDRVRRRLTEGGAAISRSRLKQAEPEFTHLVSALVKVVLELSTGPLGDSVVKDLIEGMDDVFKVMLDIASDTDVPDPLLLSASLETLYMFLAHGSTRMQMIGGNTVLASVLGRLHELAILLPYIRGPKLKDANNNKYQDLWRMCEKRYGSDRHLKDRIPQLYEETGAQGDWRDSCPELKNLHNPLMHRVLLDIVKLISLFSDQTLIGGDTTSEFQRVGKMLDDNEREKLLIGPSEGLVLVPDYDVKIEVLRVIQHVLVSTPGQFQTQEMGWLLRYLQSTGIGIGRQEAFLMEVLKLNELLIKDMSGTGFKFRQHFAKQSIRQAYEMLKANTSRDVHGSKDDEDSKIALSLQIVNLLRACSMPLSGGLRPFLRRSDFMQIVKSVMEWEDSRQSGIREPLLRTWTGREMREVLLPLVTMNSLSATGVGRYRALVRMADILQGKTDFEDMVAMRSTDEMEMWQGAQRMKTILRVDDELFKQDCKDQQNEFMMGEGLDGLLKFCERVFSSTDAYADINSKVKTQVKEISIHARSDVEEWWYEYTQAKKSQKDVVPPTDDPNKDKKESVLEKFITSRVTCTNERLTKQSGTSVKFFHDTKGSTLKMIANILKGYVEDNQKLFAKWCDDKDFKELLEVENHYWTSTGTLMEYSKIKEDKKRFAKSYQAASTTLETLNDQASVAQRSLKKLLIARGLGPGDTTRWAEDVWDCGDDVPPGTQPYVREGLVDFLQNHQATVYDPGYRSKENIEMQMQYKYSNQKIPEYKRVRNAARLILEFKEPKKLLDCLKALKENTRMSVVTVRNRFRDPQALGQRSILVYVEVLANGVKFVCELTMVINEAEAGALWMRDVNLRSELIQVLKTDCKVPPDKLEWTCEFIIYEMSSSSIRDDDVVYVQCFTDTDKYLSVNKESVSMDDTEFEDLSQRNLFYIERKAGYGTVKTGDRILLKNWYTQCYLDASMSNYGIRCRYSDATCEKSQFEFVVEEPPEKIQVSGLLGLTAFVAADQAILPTEKERKEMMRKQAENYKDPPKNLHHESKICLKVYDSSSPQRRITLGKPVGWGATSQNLKAEKKAPDSAAELQILIVHREGALKPFIEAANIKEAEQHVTSISGVQTDEQKQNEVLLKAYMAPSLQVQAPQEGGVFRRSPPTFEDIAIRQAYHSKLTADRLQQLEDDDDANQDNKIALQDKETSLDESQLPPMMVAATCRCLYSLLELPAIAKSRTIAIDEALGTVDDRNVGDKANLCRLLTLAITAATSTETGKVNQESILKAWVSAKALRTISAAFKRMPFGSIPAAERKKPHNSEDGGLGAHTKVEEEGGFDKQRLGVLKTYSAYIANILTPPLLHRLATAAQRPLEKCEVTLLVELCHAVNIITKVYYSNELRCKTAPDSDAKALENIRHQGGAKNRDQLAMKGNEGGQTGQLALPSGPGASSAQQATDGAVASALALVDEGPLDSDRASDEPKEEKQCIRGDMEARIFASLVPDRVIRILVHSMLHGMRMEASAYASARNIANEQEECVKLTSTLVQRSIHALAICMHGCEECPETSCDYNVCEAISQALSLGAQFVPRARVTQLMTEWQCEKHRKPIDEMLMDFPTFDLDGLPIHLRPMPTERVMLLGFGWHAKGMIKPPPTEAVRRLFAITSRHNFLILDVPASNGRDLPAADRIGVVAYRALGRLQRIVTHPRMRQFIGLMWDEKSREEFIEALFFESYYRKRDFQESLRLVYRFRPRTSTSPPLEQPEEPRADFQAVEGGGQRAHEALVKNRMLLTLRKTCKPRENPRAEAQLVTVSFVRSETGVLGIAGGGGMDALVMTRDALAVISMRSFLKYWAESEGSPEDYLNAEDDEDSDSDEDGIPPREPGDPTDMDEWKPDPPLRGYYPFKSLTGVWFMADQDPKVCLQFSSTKQNITFFSDGDRQRFRQHLACVLRCGDEVDAPTSSQRQQGKLWKVKPTGDLDLSGVTKEVEKMEVQLIRHEEHVKKMHVQALGNGDARHP